MADLVTDQDDPRLGHGPDTEKTPQHEAYLILSEEERAKGFVRPVRTHYTHVGLPGPGGLRHVSFNLLRDLTAKEEELYGEFNYVAFEDYPDGGSVLGRLWTQAALDSVGKGCGATTRLDLSLAETYARDPHFYKYMYCVGCDQHLPVNEFVWTDTREGDYQRVGS